MGVEGLRNSKQRCTSSVLRYLRYPCSAYLLCPAPRKPDFKTADPRKPSRPFHPRQRPPSSEQERLIGPPRKAHTHTRRSEAESTLAARAASYIAVQGSIAGEAPRVFVVLVQHQEADRRVRSRATIITLAHLEGIAPTQVFFLPPKQPTLPVALRLISRLSGFRPNLRFPVRIGAAAARVIDNAAAAVDARTPSPRFALP